MTRYVLLDANAVIYAFDSTASAEDKEKAKSIFKKLIEEGVAFAITPLIRYEILRHPAFTDQERYERLETVLNRWKVFNIDNEIANLATNLYRYDVHTAKNKEKNFEKRRFDTFHFSTAKCNDLEVLSWDRELKAWGVGSGAVEILYKNYLKETKQTE